MAKKTYHNLGSMKLKKDKDENGNLQYYVEIDQKILDKIRIDGKKISKFIQVERPTQKFDRMLAAGKIDEKEYEEKTAQFDSTIDPQTKQPRGKLSFVKFDLQAVSEE